MHAHSSLANKFLIDIGTNCLDQTIWKNPTGQAFDIPSVEKALTAYFGDPYEAVKFTQRFGRIKFGLVGSPDAIGIRHGSGRFVGYEFKTGKARQSDAQKNFQNMILNSGGEYHIVRENYSIASFK